MELLLEMPSIMLTGMPLEVCSACPVRTIIVRARV